MTQNSNSKSGQTALITGASSGIGYEFAKIFAEQGYNVVIVARSEPALQKQAQELKQKYGVQTYVIATDLSKATAPQTVVDELAKQNLRVDVLINNAGFADYGKFAEAKLDKQLEMLQLNIVTLTHLTHLLLPAMLERRNGKILNVASTASFQPGPLMAVYYATKAYVLSFSEAIANELKGTGVSVTALCPGPTASGFQQRAAMESSKLVSGKKIADAESVARAGYEALIKGKPVIIPGFKNQMMAASVRFTPRSMVTNLVRSMQDSNTSGH